MSAHVPTPYVVDSSRRRTRIRIGTKDRYPVVTVDCASANTREAKETAAFIVRACNAHDELVAALSRLVAESTHHDGAEYEDGEWLALDAARAALAKAGAP